MFIADVRVKICGDFIHTIDNMDKLVGIIILLVCIFIALLIYTYNSRTIEAFNKPLYNDMPKIPMPHHGMYINYEDYPFQEICPSVYKDKPTPCSKASDCKGRAEYCLPGVSEDGNTCKCIIINDCIQSGVC